MSTPGLLFGAAGAAATGALVTFLAYSAVVLLLAVISQRVLAGKSFLGEYFLGSRGLGLIAFTLTFAATSASAGTFAGFPALIYNHGWILAVWIAGYMVVPLCGLGLLGKRLNQVARRTGAITLPDVLRERFNSPALGYLATVLILLPMSVYLIPQFKIAAIILGTLLGDAEFLHRAGVFTARWTAGVPILGAAEDPEYLVCLLLFSVLVIGYTALGGFRAVVWTDVMQGFVMIFGVVMMLTLALYEVGGLQRATEKMSRMMPPRLGTARFQLPEPAGPGGVRIAIDTWFTLPGETTVAPARLLRTNSTAVVPAGERESNEVKVVEIVTPEEVVEILTPFGEAGPPPLPADARPLLGEPFQEYARGAGERGVYVSGPGPSVGDALGFLPVGLAISFFCFWPLSGTGQPGNMVRLMAFDSAKTLRRAVCLLSVYFGLIYLPLVIIFCCARVLAPGLDQDPDRIMPVMAFSLAEVARIPWLAGLLVAAPFAAAMSTVDSFMLMISSSLVRDLYQRTINPQASEKTIKRLSYTATLLVGVVITLAAVSPPKYLQFLVVLASGALSVSFLAPMALALYWPRMTPRGAAAGMLLGLAAYVGLYAAGWQLYGELKAYRPLGLDAFVWGLTASLLACALGSYLSPRPEEKLVRKFFGP